ncbi:hypothetical protein GGI43DRAFT_61923 [Trichoderma evansii]
MSTWRWIPSEKTTRKKAIGCTLILFLFSEAPLSSPRGCPVSTKVTVLLLIDNPAASALVLYRDGGPLILQHVLHSCGRRTVVPCAGKAKETFRARSKKSQSDSGCRTVTDEAACSPERLQSLGDCPCTGTCVRACLLVPSWCLSSQPYRRPSGRGCYLPAMMYRKLLQTSRSTMALKINGTSKN